MNTKAENRQTFICLRCGYDISSPDHILCTECGASYANMLYCAHAIGRRNVIALCLSSAGVGFHLMLMILFARRLIEGGGWRHGPSFYAINIICTILYASAGYLLYNCISRTASDDGRPRYWLAFLIGVLALDPVLLSFAW